MTHFDSSKWTGPPDEQLAPRRGAFTHRIGGHSVASDYQRFLAAQRAAAAMPPEVRRVIRLAMLLLFSPVLLWLAWLLLQSATREAIAQDNSHVLIWWGLGSIGLSLLLVMNWRAGNLVWLRKAILAVALLATVAVAIGYVYLGIDAYAHARASAPERTFELRSSCGRRCVENLHQRADGTTVQGARMGRPLAQARSCALVQRLDGEYGFTWVRVLERSRVPGRGQLAWPISREECFSDMPLSSLPR